MSKLMEKVEKALKDFSLEQLVIEREEKKVKQERLKKEAIAKGVEVVKHGMRIPAEYPDGLTRYDKAGFGQAAVHCGLSRKAMKHLYKCMKARIAELTPVEEDLNTP